MSHNVKCQKKNIYFTKYQVSHVTKYKKKSQITKVHKAIRHIMAFRAIRAIRAIWAIWAIRASMPIYNNFLCIQINGRNCVAI